MTEVAEPAKTRKRRTNAEILADQKASRKNKTAVAKRVRRTKAQIEADKVAETARREQLALERAERIPTPRPIKFKKTIEILVDEYWAFGESWNAGQKIKIAEGDNLFQLAFDRLGNFIFDKTPEQQLAEWGTVKYREVE